MRKYETEGAMQLLKAGRSHGGQRVRHGCWVLGADPWWDLPDQDLQLGKWLHLAAGWSGWMLISVVTLSSRNFQKFNQPNETVDRWLDDANRNAPRPDPRNISQELTINNQFIDNV